MLYLLDGFSLLKKTKKNQKKIDKKPKHYGKKPKNHI